MAASGLSHFQPLELNPVGGDMCKVILRLLHKPAFGQHSGWQIHIRNRTGSIQPRENVTQLFRVFPNHAARVVVLIKPFQSLVAYRSDQVVP